MKHPFEIIGPEYDALFPKMRITSPALIDSTAKRLLKNVAEGRYEGVSRATGVPQVWIATSFEREASSDFRRSPAQGDFWNKRSTHVPKNRGPFTSWAAAAIDAYSLNGLDKIGAANWTWARGGFSAENFNGFGYRDFHHMRSSYVFGGTNLQQRGKYTADGKFDADHFDMQIGVLPVMVRMAMLEPSLTLAGPWPFTDMSSPSIVPISAPEHTGMLDAFDIQRALNTLGYGPIRVDGNYGRITQGAVLAFQRAAGIEADGIAGPKTQTALTAALANSTKK